MTISTTALRELFASDLPDPLLVVEEGRARVAAEPTGIVVASRRELLAEHGGDAPTGELLEQLAARLDTEFRLQGG
ncbi:MAG TPA: hypothetical protein VM367_11210 [Pseudonocardia sp.]|nr:hypothetical protein [Pseudonocardia sp.]